LVILDTPIYLKSERDGLVKMFFQKIIQEVFRQQTIVVPPHIAADRGNMQIVVKENVSMKKYLIVLVVVLVTALALTTLVSANGGPHGGFTATTDACAGCHRTHTATGPRLLINTSTQALCMTCHGSTGTGADSNVLDGIWLEGRNPTDTTGDANTTINSPLLGGGFTNYRGAATTSSHSVDGTSQAAWGNGVARGSVSATLVGGGMDCASCHDPHGSTNYRIINTTVNGVAVTVAQVDEGAAKDYDTEQWGAGQSNLCAACHGSYHTTTAGSGSDATVATNGGYSHRVDMSWNVVPPASVTVGANNPETVGFNDGTTTVTVPLAQTGVVGGNVVVCQTCHMPHGTSAQMTGHANGGPGGGGTLPGNTTATDSALLRLNNRAVCQACHQKE